MKSEAVRKVIHRVVFRVHFSYTEKRTLGLHSDRPIRASIRATLERVTAVCLSRFTLRFIKRITRGAMERRPSNAVVGIFQRHHRASEPICVHPLLIL